MAGDTKTQKPQAGKKSWVAWLPVAIAVLAYILFPLDPFLVNEANLKEKRVFITGASLGIGKSLAFEYAKRGATHLVLVARSIDGLNKVKNDIIRAHPASNLKIDLISISLSDENACIHAINEAVRYMGGIDYLVLNHVTGSRLSKWLDMDDRSEYMDVTFKVNTFSYIWLATAAIHSLKESNGQIVVVSSLAGHVGTPKTGVYSSSKHALHGFFDAFRNELIMSGFGNIGITLCAIGATDTEGAQSFKDKITTVTWDPPEDAARAIVNGGALRRRDIYHPQYIVYPTVLLDRLFPDLIDRLLRGSV